MEARKERQKHHDVERNVDHSLLKKLVPSFAIFIPRPRLVKGLVALKEFELKVIAEVVEQPREVIDDLKLNATPYRKESLVTDLLLLYPSVELCIVSFPKGRYS